MKLQKARNSSGRDFLLSLCRQSTSANRVEVVQEIQQHCLRNPFINLDNSAGTQPQPNGLKSSKKSKTREMQKIRGCLHQAVCPNKGQRGCYIAAINTLPIILGSPSYHSHSRKSWQELSNLEKLSTCAIVRFSIG